MIIGIDARFLGPIGKGLGRYTEKLILNLEKIDRENQYFIFLKHDNFNDYNPKNPNFHKIEADFPWYSLAEQIYFPRLIKKHRLDLMHFPHFNVPVFYLGKIIVTIHDLIITNYPTKKASTLGPLKYFLKHFGYQIVIWLAVKRAVKIITVSRYSKEQIIKHFKIKPEKIQVTYEACDLAEKIDNTQAILENYRIKKPYLLYVGNVYPHKNIARLLEAFVRIVADHPQFKLVMVGKEDYFYKKTKCLVDDLNLSDKVIFPGFVPDCDLKAFYQSTSAYVFPSLEEGFGLPPLEAMSFGAPVISSNSSCLPEILGQAAYYFDPHSIEQIISSINRVLEEDKLKEQLIVSGYSQIKKYSWSDLASQTLKIYQNILY